MELFHVIDDGVVQLRSKGVYRQVKVYRRGRDVFAAHGGGYIKLQARTGTTRPDVSWDHIEADGVELTNNGQPFYALAETVKAA